MSTGQEIFNGAVAKSTQNEPNAFGSAEIIRRINDRLDGLFLVGTRVNPGFFGITDGVAESAGTWARNPLAITIERIEQNSDGAEVVVVPFNDRQAEPSKLSVYEWGQVFTAITTNAGTPSGTLDFFTATGPTPIAALATALDSRFPETFDELLVLELAIDFAIKDGRIDEEGVALIPDRNAWLQRWIDFLLTATANVRRRYGNVKPVNIEQLIPLLAGGGARA